MGNKNLGTYPNGVPYDKRRYNPYHSKHLRPPSNSPAFGYLADVWVTRTPYTTTWEFQGANFMRKRGPGWDRTGIDGSRGLDSLAGSNAGDTEGIDPTDGEGTRGSHGAAGSRRASTADPTMAAGSGQMGTRGFGEMRGATRPFARQLGVTGTGMDRRAGPFRSRFNADDPVFPRFPP